MPNIPHLGLPLRYVGYPPSPVMVEQDSIEDVAACVQAILLTRPGQRIGLSDFGVEDQAFLQGGADFAEIKKRVALYEPRVGLNFESEWDFQEFVQKVKAIIKGATVG